MSRYCLDTSAYSRFQRGDQAVVDLMDRAEWIGMPSVTLGELRTGFLLGSRNVQNEADLTEFLGNPVVTELTVDGEVSRHYAEIVVDLRRAGVQVVAIGQYLQPTREHLPVDRYVPPAAFDALRERGMKLGFLHIEAGPLVRSSYHAERHRPDPAPGGKARTGALLSIRTEDGAASSEDTPAS